MDARRERKCGGAGFAYGRRWVRVRMRMSSPRKPKAGIAALCIGLVALTAAGCIGSSGNRSAKDPDESTGRSSGLTIKLMRFEHPGQAVRTNTPVLREIYAKTGTRLLVEGIPQSNYKEKKKVLFGTNNIPDVILVEQNDIQQYANSGIFLNLTDYMEYMPHFRNMIEQYPEIRKLFIDGKLYGFPITDQHTLTVAKAPMLRTDLLAKLNIPIPKTFDELYAVLKKLKETHPDSIPWTSRGLGFIDAFAFGMGSGYGIYFDPDIGSGQYVYGNNKAEFKEVLVYLNRLYEEKLLDPDFSVNSLQKWSETIGAGKSFFYYDNNTYAASFNLALQKIEPGAKLDLVPYLKNGKGKARGFVYAKGWLTDNYAISSKVKDPVAVVKFYDWLYSPEGTEVANFGKLGETYELVNGEPRMLESLLARYGAAADPTRTMQSEMGTGYLALAPNVDSRPLTQGSDAVLTEWAARLERDPAFYRIPGVAPAFTEEENEQIKQILSRLGPVNDDVIRFIMGSRPLDEFAQFAEALTENGAPELERLYNAALERVGK